MTASKKKPRKAYRPRAYLLNPMAAFYPVPQSERDRLMTTFYSAVEAMTKGTHPGEEDWRQLADAINTIETMATHTGNLPPEGVMPAVDAAIAAMAAAARRYRAGQGMRLDAAGIQAIRTVLDLYGQCLEQLTEREMSAARSATEVRLRKIYDTRRGEENVVMV